jgi:Flp pilus assembly CpaF family ATPase
VGRFCCLFWGLTAAHDQIDVTLGRLIQLGAIYATSAACLSAAVKGLCNIIVTGGINAGNTTRSPPVPAFEPCDKARGRVLLAGMTWGLSWVP